MNSFIFVPSYLNCGILADNLFMCKDVFKKPLARRARVCVLRKQIYETRVTIFTSRQCTALGETLREPMRFLEGIPSSSRF